MNKAPEICGLVLAGGRSTRMGSDKGMLNLHGLSQCSFLFRELSTICHDVYTSCRPEQDIEKQFHPLRDVVTNSGPLGGLLTAFLHRSHCAWLSVAVDMPNVNVAVLKQLIADRDPRKLATCYVNRETNQPEPLLTLWEPKALSVLVECISVRNCSLRKVLEASDVKRVLVKEQSVLCNVNVPNDVCNWKNANSKIHKSQGVLNSNSQ